MKVWRRYAMRFESESGHPGLVLLSKCSRLQSNERRERYLGGGGRHRRERYYSDLGTRRRFPHDEVFFRLAMELFQRNWTSIYVFLVWLSLCRWRLEGTSNNCSFRHIAQKYHKETSTTRVLDNHSIRHRGKCPNSGRVLIQDTLFFQVRVDEETITQFFFYFF